MSSGQDRSGQEVAVIGMAGRFPGADDVRELWANLSSGVESISDFSVEECIASGASEDLVRDPLFVRRGAVLREPCAFDAVFFGYLPREARTMDPQQRIFLEVCWQALEDAGYAPGTMAANVGVYGGSGLNYYLLKSLLGGAPSMESVVDVLTFVGNEKDFLTSRVSYKLGLTGPSVAVQSACSTSLVAVHQACQALLAFECDMALAGGVSLQAPRMKGYRYSEAHILSRDGHCRAFDRAATGTVFGEGAGVVVLKRLEDALADRDSVRAVIKGTAVNNDGADRIGYTAPGVAGQVRVVGTAHALAGVRAEDVSYIEAHGTGTQMGDPIEVKALTEVFRRTTGRTGYCALGSIKTNIGHLDVAAGVTGLIKAVLALEHRQIPPSLHFSEQNPELHLETTPFFVNTALREWTHEGRPLIAGVSSFGMGGTNAHVVVAEAPAKTPAPAREGEALLVLSARSASALSQARERLARHLDNTPPQSIAQAAFTLSEGRVQFSHRAWVVARDARSAAVALREEASAGRAVSGQTPSDSGMQTVFLFTGQGSEYASMGSVLYERFPAFARGVDRCAEVLRTRLGVDVRDLLFRAAGERIGTDLVQPALFTFESSLALLWRELGVQPSACMGHSLGEYVAAWCAGIFTLEDALDLVVRRGRIMSRAPAGLMCAVTLSEAGVRPLLDDDLDLASVNGPRQCVVSGTEGAVNRFVAATQQIPGARTHVLRTAGAFHSRLMEPSARELERTISDIRASEPRIPVISNLTGAPLSIEQASSPAYWAKHLRSTVRFADGARALLDRGAGVFLEIGPVETLGALVRSQAGRDATLRCVCSLGRARAAAQEAAELLHAAGQLWSAGVRLDLSKLYVQDERRRISLPTYPFERERYCVEPVSGPAPAPQSRASAAETPPAVVASAMGAESVSEGAPALSESLAAAFHEATGLSASDATLRRRTFLELGLESLVLADFASLVGSRFGRKIGLMELMEAHNTVDSLAEWLMGSVGGRSDSAALSARAVLAQAPPEGAPETVVPSTSAQRELWLSCLMGPEASCAYNESFSMAIDGRLDRPSLERAVRGVIARHESLRSTFSPDGTLMRVGEASAVADRVIAALYRPRCAGKTLDEDFAGLVRENVGSAFHLVNGPLLRVVCLSDGPDHHRILVGIHHAICDGWSLNVVLRELSALYTAESRGTAAELEGPPRFTVFAREIERYGSTAEGKRDEEYWRARLSGLGATAEFPPGRERPPARTYAAARADLDLGAVLSDQLKALGARTGCTLSTVLLAGLQMLMARVSDEPESVIGLPVAGQPRVGRRGLVGHCLTLIPIRSRVEQDDTVLSFLRKVKDGVSTDYDHASMTYGDLLRLVPVHRDPSRMPLLSVGFTTTLEFRSEVVEMGDCAIRYWLNPRRFETFEVFVNVRVEADGNVALLCHYNTDLFSPSVMAFRLAEWKAMLEAMVRDADTPVDMLPVLCAEEEAVLRPAAPQATPSEAVARSVHEIVWAEAGRRSDAPAVSFSGRTLSYGELRSRVQTLAATLREFRLPPSSPVALVLSRSSDMVLAMLGVLASGSAYVPVDPRFPPQRIQYMLSDCGARVIITQAEHLSLVAGLQAHILRLDQQVAATSGVYALPSLRSEDLAYVMYTSGSTGKPKGVQVPHRALSSFLRSVADQPGLSSRDVFLALTTYSFDISILELFLPLTVGAQVVIASTEEASDPTLLMRLMSSHGVTAMQATPATWRLLLGAGWAGRPGLKALCGGEAMSRDLAAALLPRVGELWNMYGPTETTIWSTCLRVLKPDDAISIGRPLSNTRVYVVDRNMKRRPVGVWGELCIGGDGVASGYLGRPDLTAERFPVDPWTATPPGRLYRTGDVCRFRSDGTLEYSGRMDNQVKIRGFRIELGEIETVLGDHPAVASCVAVARKDLSGNAVLAAYYIARGSETPSVENLRAHIRQRLPDYMMPSFLVRMDEFPLTPNRKVDRKALPDPLVDRGPEPPSAGAPKSADETFLLDLWRKLLGRPSLGSGDDFFEAGGHSLLAAEMVATLARRVGREVPLALLFRAPTVDKLSALVFDRAWKPDWSCVVPIREGSLHPPLFLVHGAEGNILLYRDLAAHLAEGQAVYGIQSPGLDGQSSPDSDLKTAAARYVKEIRRIQPSGPYCVGGYCLGGAIALEMARILRSEGQDIAFLAMFETYNVATIQWPQAAHVRVYNTLLNLMYHARNALAAERGGHRAFLRGKLIVQTDRLRVGLSEAWSQVAGLLRRSSPADAPFLRVDRVYDAALVRYRPEPYDGPVDLYTAQGRFAGFRDVHTWGWADVLRGKLHIHSLPVYLRGSMSEPYVRVVADSVSERLDEERRARVGRV